MATDCGKHGHQDSAQAHQARLDQRFLQFHTFGASFLVEI